MFLLEGDALDLDANVLRKAGNLDGSASRGTLGVEELGVLGVHLSEVVHVAEEDVDLDDLGKAGAGLGEHGLEVLEAAVGLLGDGAGHKLAGLGVEGDGAAAEDKAASLDSLGVWAEGCGCVRSGNRRLAH